MSLQRIFVVNLARRPEKKQRVLARLRAVAPGVPIDFFRAVDGLELGDAYLDAHGFAMYRGWKSPGAANPYHARDLKWGEVGCALSHFMLWRRIVEEDINTALVVEDDAMFSPDARARLEPRLAELSDHDPNWDLCYVGRVRQGDPTPEPQLCDGIVVPSFSYCTHAYILSTRGTRKLLASGFERGIFPVDELLPALYCEHPRADLRVLLAAAPRLRAYAIEPGLSTQDGAVSDIETSSAIASVSAEHYVRWSAQRRSLVRRVHDAGIVSTLVVETELEDLELPVEPNLAPLIRWMVQHDRFALEAAAHDCTGIGMVGVVAVVNYLANAGALVWEAA